MLDLVKLPVPASLQFRGNQAIAWVDFVVLVERTLGKGLRDEFVKYKTQEWETYHLSVSAWEVERYSHMF